MGTTQTIPHSAEKVVILTPARQVIGAIRAEGQRIVFVRRISTARRERVLFRTLDAWPLGAHARARLQAAGCTDLRYETPEGVYRVSMTAFLDGAIRRTFPSNPEDQYFLPRTAWAFTPKAGSVHQLSLSLGIPA